MPSTRRTFVAAGVSVLAGCTTSEPQNQQTTESTTTEPSQQETDSTTTEPDTTAEETTDGPNPDRTLQFGESHVDTGLEITVEAPSVETEFGHDGETYEMPDDEALAFTPVEFHNTESDGPLPMDGPLFTLLGDGTETLETNSVDHPAFDPSIRRREFENVSTASRWSPQGVSVSSGERVPGTAVFRVPASIDSSSLAVVYDSDRIRDDRFGGEVVAWES